MTGAYWYATNGAVIVTLFAVVALELKHRAPKAHTMLELVYTRWGKAAHITFFFFACLTNLLVRGDDSRGLSCWPPPLASM